MTMKTTGDKILDKALDKIGGKGLFVKELDRALREGRIDISVHSLKDMPMQTPEDLPLLAYAKRGKSLRLPGAARRRDRVGTRPSRPAAPGTGGASSCRGCMGRCRSRASAGNIHTRLQKLDSGEYGALILACAGLERVGLQRRIHHVFSLDEMIPSAGQGILSVQGRAGEDYSWLKETDDFVSRTEALAERAFVRELDGGCSSPICRLCAGVGGRGAADRALLP